MSIHPTAAQLATVICRAYQGDKIPEAKLWLAVLHQAICDACTDNSYKHIARDFFIRKNHSAICELIGINPTYVTETMKKHGQEWAS